MSNTAPAALPVDSPPRAHRHCYHGVLAPDARLRPDVVRYGRRKSSLVLPIPRALPPGVDAEGEKDVDHDHRAFREDALW